MAGDVPAGAPRRPVHVAFNLDGRLWPLGERMVPAARRVARILPLIDGLPGWCEAEGIRHVTIWPRTSSIAIHDVRLDEQIHDRLRAACSAIGWECRVLRLGRREGGSEPCPEVGHVNLVLGYDGRDDFVSAVRMALDANGGEPLTGEEIDGRMLVGCPRPDLLVQTARLYAHDGLLLWQSGHSELYFHRRLSRFAQRDVTAMLADYSRRERRYGA